MTKIQWTNETWNPVTGCTKVSAGCKNCYAERMAKRLRGRYGYPADEPFRVTLHPDLLEQPLRWRKPRMVFVDSMGDLFHENVPDEFIDKVFAVMAVCQQHTFQQLTKRPERAVEYYASQPLDRIVALIHNARYEQGTDTAFERAIRDRLQRFDLENRKTTRARGKAGRRVLHGSDDKPMPAGQGGISDEGRLSLGGRDDQRQAGGGGRASHDLDTSQRADKGWSDDQSQERGEGRQPTGESGIGNIQRTEASCDHGVGGEASRRAGVKTPEDEVERIRRVRDSAASGGWHDGEDDSGTLCYETKGGVGDRQSQDLEAHLVWPLPNVWIGVSCEDQESADERIPLLFQTPAAVKFVSLEPLLEPVDLDPWGTKCNWEHMTRPAVKREWPEIAWSLRAMPVCDNNGLNWVIVGGESGPGSRSCDLVWIRSIVRQCKMAKVPCFVKQLAIDGRVSSDPSEWPEDLKVREMPR